MIELAIAMSNWMNSFYDSNIKYWESLRDSGIDDEAVESMNRTLNG